MWLIRSLDWGSSSFGLTLRVSFDVQDSEVMVFREYTCLSRIYAHGSQLGRHVRDQRETRKDLLSSRAERHGNRTHFSKATSIGVATLPPCLQGKIVATSLLWCGDCLNSARYMPCQVPKFNLPSVIGSCKDVPMSAVFVCEAESSGPSSVCNHGILSGTILSKHMVMSFRTSGS